MVVVFPLFKSNGFLDFALDGDAWTITFAKLPGPFPLSCTRIKEHHAPDTSAVFEYCQTTGHNINPQIVKVLSDENSTIKRRVKEAIAIKQRKTSLDMDEGLDLPAIYNPLLGILLCNLPPHNVDEI